MPMNMVTELRSAKCDLEPRTFRDLVRQRFVKLHRGRTYEDLVRHPDEAHAFCEDLRAHLIVPALPDHIILGNLENSRKAAELPHTRSHKRRAAAPAQAPAPPPAPATTPARRGRPPKDRAAALTP